MRVVYGARISLLVGVAATGISITVGVVIGLLAGYYGSVVDTVLARFMDVVLSLPYLVFALALISIVGPSLWISIVVIAFFSWATVGRVVSGQTLMLKEREFVEAARSIGTGDLRIMFVEILPNVMGARHRLCHTPDPCRHRVRSNAFVPRPRSGTAHAELGEHARRIAALLLGRLVVRRFPRRGPAFDDSGVQPPRRFGAGRPGPVRPVTKDVAVMGRFLARRAALGALVMWAVATVVFVMYFVAPHDVARLIAGRQASPQTVAAVSRDLGLNRSVAAQYGSFLVRLLHGDLGYSYTNSEPVTSLIAQGLPVTFSLAIGGAVLWLLLGVTLGDCSRQATKVGRRPHNHRGGPPFLFDPDVPPRGASPARAVLRVARSRHRFLPRVAGTSLLPRTQPNGRST